MTQSNRRYTKGDCYAICEFLTWLVQDYRTNIREIADEIGYEHKYIIELLERLYFGIDSVIAEEQDEHDYTEQMAEILELKHIKGDEDDTKSY